MLEVRLESSAKDYKRLIYTLLLIESIYSSEGSIHYIRNHGLQFATRICDMLRIAVERIANNRFMCKVVSGAGRLKTMFGQLYSSSFESCSLLNVAETTL